jgi:hypothetical protein
VVERIMVDPSVVLITEADVRAPRLMPGGLCLVCGTWVDHENERAYLVTLEDAAGERRELLAHVTCLAEVAHPSSGLRPVTRPAPDPEPEPDPDPQPEPAPDRPAADYLDPKPFTADGR